MITITRESGIPRVTGRLADFPQADLDLLADLFRAEHDKPTACARERSHQRWGMTKETK